MTAAGLVLAAAAVCGRALFSACGITNPSTAAPAAGLALLLALAEIAVALPGRALTAALVLLLTTLGAAAYLARRRIWPVLPVWAIVTAVGILALAMLPFGSSGQVGLLGAGTNDDMGEHLLAAWALGGAHAAHFSKLVASGYPIGPHALVSAISRGSGISLEHTFMGLIVATPVLLGLAAGALLRAPGETRAGSRQAVLLGLLAATVGLCYLQAAFLAQASFKEPLQAMLLLAFAATVREQRTGNTRVPGRLRAVPLGVLAAGSVYVYSYPGLAWLLGTLAVWVVIKALRRAAMPSRGQLARTAAPATAAFVLLVAPELPRLVSFSGSGYNHETANVFGNLTHALPPQEALGIWPRLDFRFDLPLGSAGGVVSMLALAALVLCLIETIRRRDDVMLSAFAVSAALYGITAIRSPYSAAKALTVLAPVVTLILARQLLLLLSAPSARRWRDTAAAGLLAVLFGWAAYSDLEVLRDAPVGPDTHARELARLHALIVRSPTVFLGADDFVHWELRGADIATPPQPLYTTRVVPLRLSKAQPELAVSKPRGAQSTRNRFAGVGLAFDFDSLPAPVLDRFTFAILPRSGYRSAPPPNWHLKTRTRSYELWRREGPTVPRGTLQEIDNPGAILNCSSPAGRAFAARRGIAMVGPPPVVGERTGWVGDVGYAGRTAYQKLRLTRGRWVISLQYAAARGATVTGPHMHAELPPSLEPLGPYWLVGTIRVARTGSVKLGVTNRGLPPLGRLTGAIGLTRAPSPTGMKALGRITASRFPLAERRVALSQACGRYVDWYRKG